MITVKTKTRKAKMCNTCSKYKDSYSRMLREGDEFICYNGRIPAAAYLFLSEEKRSLYITIDPSDDKQVISLADIIHVQKGFSHAGHISAATQYDPIRCFSITIKCGSGWKTFDLKGHSGIHCQHWVNGLNTALFIYRRIAEQETAIEQYTAEGYTVPVGKSIYFPEKKPTKREKRGTKRTRDEQIGVESDGSVVVIHSGDQLVPELEIVEEPDVVVVEVSDHSSRGSTPFSDILDISSVSESRTSPVVRKAHYKIRTINSPYRPVNRTRRSPQPHHRDTLTQTTSSQRSLTDWRTRTTESNSSGAFSIGLPYKGSKNPLASYCTCHAYAIEPSRAMLLPTDTPTNSDPFSSCCEQCRDKCRLIRDLATF